MRSNSWPITIAEVFKSIELERFKQVCKWGDQVVSDDRLLAILMEEVGEVAKCLCDRSPKDDLRLELVQVAAVAVKWLQMLHIPR